MDDYLSQLDEKGILKDGNVCFRRKIEKNGLTVLFIYPVLLHRR